MADYTVTLSVEAEAVIAGAGYEVGAFVSNVVRAAWHGLALDEERYEAGAEAEARVRARMEALAALPDAMTTVTPGARNPLG